MNGKDSYPKGQVQARRRLRLHTLWTRRLHPTRQMSEFSASPDRNCQVDSAYQTRGQERREESVSWGSPQGLPRPDCLHSTQAQSIGRSSSQTTIRRATATQLCPFEALARSCRGFCGGLLGREEHGGQRSWRTSRSASTALTFKGGCNEST